MPRELPPRTARTVVVAERERVHRPRPVQLGAQAAPPAAAVESPVPVGVVAAPSSPSSTASPVAAAAVQPEPAQREARPQGRSTRMSHSSSSAEERGQAALATISYPWEELGYSIEFEPYRGGSRLGYANPQARRITIYVRDDQSDHSLRATIAHEIGHALDFVTGDDAQRARYREIRGIPAGTPWYPCRGCSDYASPAGDWAEVFAYYVVGPGDFRSEMGPPPDQRQLQELQPLFAPPSQRAPEPARQPEPEPEEESGGLFGIVPGLG